MKPKLYSSNIITYNLICQEFNMEERKCQDVGAQEKSGKKISEDGILGLFSCVFCVPIGLEVFVVQEDYQVISVNCTIDIDIAEQITFG